MIGEICALGSRGISWAVFLCGSREHTFPFNSLHVVGNVFRMCLLSPHPSPITFLMAYAEVVKINN